jgi:hypothetical protein
VQLSGEQPLGDILRERDKTVRNVRWQCQIDPRDLLPVDINELTTKRDSGVQSVAQETEVFPHLQRARLDTHGLGIVRRFDKPVDDPARNSSSQQLDADGQADRTRPHHENLIQPEGPLAPQRDLLVSIPLSEDGQSERTAELRWCQRQA